MARWSMIPRGRPWNAAETVVVIVVLAWGVSLATVVIWPYVPWVWRFGHLQTGMLSVGGGAGEGRIMLAAGAGSGPMVELTGPGAGPGGPEGDALRPTASGIWLSPGPGAVMSLRSGTRHTAVGLGQAASGQASLWLSDPATGRPSWAVRLDADGRGVVNTGPDAAGPLRP
jgi:hypothetical protein